MLAIIDDEEQLSYVNRDCLLTRLDTAFCLAFLSSASTKEKKMFAVSDKRMLAQSSSTMPMTRWLSLSLSRFAARSLSICCFCNQ